MIDLKTFNSALEQLEEERGIPKEQIIEAIEQALAAAYKKDYGKKGQIVRARFDLDSGKTEFEQVKIVVDEETIRIPVGEGEEEIIEEDDMRPRFNPEHHILIDDARKIKKDVGLEEEMVFPLEAKEDYGRIAAQTAKQVIIQKIREAEKVSVLGEYSEKVGEVVTGIVQRVERGNVFVDLGRTVGLLPLEEQIPREHYRQGGRIKVYVVDAIEGPRGINIRLSRSHPELLKELFKIEAPEIASGVVEIKSVAREAGARSKVAVHSNDEKVDPVGSMVGQRGVRVSTVMNELAGEKIDIIEWSEDPATFVAGSLSPARITDIELNTEERSAHVVVSDDQLSLAIGKGGQNVRLAAKLTGWKIDIEGTEGEPVAASDGEEVAMKEAAPADVKEKTAEEVEQKVAEQEIAEEVVEEKTGEVHQVESADEQETTPEKAEKEEAEAESSDEKTEDKK